MKLGEHLVAPALQIPLVDDVLKHDFVASEIARLMKVPAKFVVALPFADLK